MDGVRERIEATGATLLHLPPYSPEFYPIETEFALSQTVGSGDTFEHDPCNNAPQSELK